MLHAVGLENLDPPPSLAFPVMCHVCLICRPCIRTFSGVSPTVGPGSLGAGVGPTENEWRAAAARAASTANGTRSSGGNATPPLPLRRRSPSRSRSRSGSLSSTSTTRGRSPSPTVPSQQQQQQQRVPPHQFPQRCGSSPLIPSQQHQRPPTYPPTANVPASGCGISGGDTNPNFLSSTATTAIKKQNNSNGRRSAPPKGFPPTTKATASHGSYPVRGPFPGSSGSALPMEKASASLPPLLNSPLTTLSRFNVLTEVLEQASHQPESIPASGSPGVGAATASEMTKARKNRAAE